VDVECEVEVANTDDVSQTADEKKLSLSTSCTALIGCQCDLLKAKHSRLSVFEFKDNPSAIQYYSGFDNYDHFMMFFQVLGSAVHQLSYKCFMLELPDELFLTLIKLRQAKDNFELGLFLDSIKVQYLALSALGLTFCIFS